MVKLANILSSLQTAKILVIGDMLLDTYTIGKAKRISPEAPVAVVTVQKEEHRPGGAGNVILNLLSLGAEVTAVGRIGVDLAGKTLLKILKDKNVNTEMMVFQENYLTPLKNRVIADNQQIVRIDHEQLIDLDFSLEQHITAHLPTLLKGVQAVAVSDYGKGLLTNTLLSAIIQQAKDHDIPVIIDPKGHDFKKYKGCTVIKPNLTEAFTAANMTSTSSLEEVADKVLQQTQAELLMLTRSEAGISLFNQERVRSDFPVHVKEVKDVTGAGDTVLAMLTYAIANGLSYSEAAQLCNIAAGIAIEHVGCACITLSDLALRLFEYNINHKVFDQEHLLVLKEVLKQKSFNLAILPQVNQLTPGLFQALRSITQESHFLLLYIEDIEPNSIFIDMLNSLKEVDFIVLHLDSLRILREKLIPKQTYCYDNHQHQFLISQDTSYLFKDLSKAKLD